MSQQHGKGDELHSSERIGQVLMIASQPAEELGSLHSRQFQLDCGRTVSGSKVFPREEYTSPPARTNAIAGAASKAGGGRTLGKGLNRRLPAPDTDVVRLRTDTHEVIVGITLPCGRRPLPTMPATLPTPANLSRSYRPPSMAPVRRKWRHTDSERAMRQPNIFHPFATHPVG